MMEKEEPRDLYRWKIKNHDVKSHPYLDEQSYMKGCNIKHDHGDLRFKNLNKYNVRNYLIAGIL